LVYSVDDKDDGRHSLAVQIVDRAVEVDCWLTVQSLSEFYWAVTRKRIMPAARAATLVRHWLTLFPSTTASAHAVRAALADAVAGRAAYWDALLVATAAEAGCRLILTEDLADGTALGGVAIHNPFATAGGLTGRARALLDP
jgi:predicted nucleic acid-binding protein